MGGTLPLTQWSQAPLPISGKLGGRAMMKCDFKTHQWKYLYRAAVFETNKRLMPMRIPEAQSTIVDRINELSRDTGFDVELEREALDDALYANVPDIGVF
jgi:hypothetical protein